MAQERIKIYISSLSSIQIYGDEVDVSDLALAESLPSVREFIDSEDFDIGLFAFGSIAVSFDNSLGKFNGAEDARSIFSYTRDKAKVRIAVESATITYATDGAVSASTLSETTIFRGLLNDPSSKFDAVNDIATFEILSYDAILSQVKIEPGQIATGDLLSDALSSLLNQDLVTSILTVDNANIVLDNDVAIDDPTFFDNLNGLDLLKALLPAANSVILIDDSTIYAQSRDEDIVSPTVYLYGRYDIHGRENVIDLFDFNDGLQRTFNSVVVNDSESNDPGSILEYGIRQKQFTFQFITSSATEDAISQRMVDEFRIPKLEISVVIPLSIGKDVSLLQQVSLNYPLQVVPDDGEFLPVLGESEYGDPDMPYPREYGSISIDEDVAFKIIEKEHDLSGLTTKLKLRQIGTETSDGYF